MQDSDEYDIDDIVLDEETLALLDKQEQQYFNGRTSVELLPPAKRQRTDSGPAYDVEDLPEISVVGGSIYGLGRHASTLGKTWNSSDVNGVVPSGNPKPVSIARDGPSTSVVQVPVQPVSRASAHVQSSRQRSTYLPPQTSRQHVQNSQVAQRQSHRSEPQFVASRLPSSSPQGHDFREDLRRQLEELQKENVKFRADLQAALDMRYAKEGEVAVLRKGMEKTAQEHAAQVAKLKAAKDEADAKQAQLQKDTKEQIERLKTQFTFKQHEMEASSLKPPWSSRTRRIGKDPPATPLNVPSQISGWNQSRLGRVGSSKSVVDSPFPRIRDNVSSTPKAQQIRRQLPPSTNKSVKLPGFHDAFAPTQSLRYSQDFNDKGKGREKRDIWKVVNTPSFEFNAPFSRSAFPQRSPPSSPTPGSHAINREDVRMCGSDLEDDHIQGINALEDDIPDADVEMMEGEFSPEPFEEVEPFNWEKELRRIILTHSQPSSSTPTLQVLMKVSFPADLPVQTVEIYSAACTKIFEMLATTSTIQDWMVTIYLYANALVQIAQVLHVAHSIPELTALLNMLSLLILSLPSFGSCLISASEAEDIHRQPVPSTLTLISDIIRDYLYSREGAVNSVHIMSLMKEMFGFLETLCWRMPPENVERLAHRILSRNVLSVILDASQAPWILSRSTRLLIYLTTYADPFPPLEGGNRDADKELGRNTFGKIPHVEWLCSYLIDTKRQGEEVDSMRIYILTYIAVLAISSADSLSVLLESHTVIPSLVLFLAQLTTPIWEEEEALISSPSTLTSLIQTLTKTLFLLHHLVFGTEPPCSLSHKLQHAPHRQFNGITHSFIVTLGRLSYADSPDWVPAIGRSELDNISAMARDLLEQVVEGPEVDAVYAVYQGEDCNDDEKEMERLLSAGA